jgi:hypothetical protein
MFGPDRSYAIYKLYPDGRRPVCVKRRVTLEYARWWCDNRPGYTYGRGAAL